MWLCQEVRALSEGISAEQSRYHYITIMRDILEKQMDRVNTEVKLYVSTNSTDKKKSFRWILSYRLTLASDIFINICHLIQSQSMFNAVLFADSALNLYFCR